MNDIDIHADAKAFFKSAPERLRNDAEPVLRLLSTGFEVTWFRAVSDKIWHATVKPQRVIRERFGLAYEYFVIGNTFGQDFHVKTLMEEPPLQLRDRIDNQLRFVASEAPGFAAICAGWARDKRISIVPLDATSAKEITTDAGRSREKLEGLLAASLSVRDRFDDSDPVRTPGEFFGREGVVNELLGRVSQGRSVAAFGLRRIGKTSLLRRIQDRLWAQDELLPLISFEACNSQDIKGGRWFHLLDRILQNWGKSIASAASDTQNFSLPKHDALAVLIKDGKKLGETGLIAQAFVRDFEKLRRCAETLATSKNRRPVFVAIFDEADHLYPGAQDAGYWIEEYFYFWNQLQAMKRGAATADENRLVFLLGGVNPAIVEMGSINDKPNPLFELSTLYLKPMTIEETVELLNGLGRPMGLVFEVEAVNVIYRFTGGHPWLIRKIGSLVHAEYRGRVGQKQITEREAEKVLKKARTKVHAHVDWILKHLQQVAPDEYALLRDLSLKGEEAYLVDWQDREFRETFASHLEEYGLVRFNDDKPVVALEIIKEALTRGIPTDLSTQMSELKVMVESLEKSIRTRLIADISRERSRDEAIDAITAVVPREAKNRPKTKDQLNVYGRVHGLQALLEQMNWDDYILLLDRYHNEIKWTGVPLEPPTRIQLVRAATRFAHLVRHQNEAEVRTAIKDDGFDACRNRLADVLSMITS